MYACVDRQSIDVVAPVRTELKVSALCNTQPISNPIGYLPGPKRCVRRFARS